MVNRARTVLNGRFPFVVTIREGDYHSGQPLESLHPFVAMPRHPPKCDHLMKPPKARICHQVIKSSSHQVIKSPGKPVETIRAYLCVWCSGGHDPGFCEPIIICWNGNCKIVFASSAESVDRGGVKKANPGRGRSSSPSVSPPRDILSLVE
jgi:hypothetical protein